MAHEWTDLRRLPSSEKYARVIRDSSPALGASDWRPDSHAGGRVVRTGSPTALLMLGHAARDHRGPSSQGFTVGAQTLASEPLKTSETMLTSDRNESPRREQGWLDVPEVAV